MGSLPRFPVLAAFLAAACSKRAPADVSAKPARLAAADAVVTCEEWVRRATANPELDVERVPAPVALDPPPIPKRLSKGVVGKNGYAEVRIRVLVDTLGAADMRTFAIVKSTHPTLTRSVRTAVAKWKFVPAEVGGCKVPRNFNWGAVAGSPKSDGSGAPR